MNHTTTHRAASDARESAAYADHITDELHRYEEHLRDVRGLAEGSYRNRTRIVGRLLHKKFAGRPIDISELRAGDVRLPARQKEDQGQQAQNRLAVRSSDLAMSGT